MSRRWLLTPGLLWTAAFFFAPLVLLVVYSFGQIDVITFQMSFGWTVSNYQQLASALYLNAALRSVALTVAATAGCALLGFPVAYTISRARGRAQTLLLVAVIAPFWISFVVRTFAWINLLSADGLVTWAFRKLGLVQAHGDLLYGQGAIAVGMLYNYLPLMILPIFVVLERIDPVLLDAAADIGLSSAATFRRVILPLAAPGIVAGCLLVGIPATGEYTIPAILGGGKVLMIGNIISDQFLQVGNYPLGSALAAALMAVLVVVLIVSRRRLTSIEDVS
jgi:ABC-type spermidine/putrescine transport system permease subunit I